MRIGPYLVSFGSQQLVSDYWDHGQIFLRQNFNPFVERHYVVVLPLDLGIIQNRTRQLKVVQYVLKRTTEILVSTELRNSNLRLLIFEGIFGKYLIIED